MEDIREEIAKDLAVIATRGRAEYTHYTREDIWLAVLNEGTDDLYLEDARLIMVGLHSQGVVRKKEELPIITKKGYYYMTEPLIEEE